MNKFFTLCCAVLLSACAAPAVHYYQLPDSVFRQPNSTDTITLSVLPSDVVKSDALVYQTSPQTVHFANRHLWAQRVDEAAANVLANALNDLSPSRRYAPQTDRAACPCVRVTLQRFQGSYDGTVRVAGFAQFYDANGKLTHSRNFSVERPQQGDGYAAMVVALNAALKDAAAQIIQ